MAALWLFSNVNVHTTAVVAENRSLSLPLLLRLFLRDRILSVCTFKRVCSCRNLSWWRNSSGIRCGSRSLHDHRSAVLCKRVPSEPWVAPCPSLFLKVFFISSMCIMLPVVRITGTFSTALLVRGSRESRERFKRDKKCLDVDARESPPLALSRSKGVTDVLHW